MFVYTPPRQRAAQYKAALAQALSSIKATSSFSCSGALHGSINLQVTGLDGPLQLPLEAEQAAALQGICSKFNIQTCSNKKASTADLQLQPEEFAVTDTAEWQVKLQCMVADAVAALKVEYAVEARLSKLLFLLPGNSLKLSWDQLARQDSGSVARLIVLLPSRHAGGQLVIRHAGAAMTYGRNELPPDLLNYVAFTGASHLEITKVTAGHRVCLVYGLHRYDDKQAHFNTALPAPPAAPTAATPPPQQATICSAGTVCTLSTTPPTAQSAAEQAAAMSQFIVRPGQPLADMLPAHVVNPRRRPKRIAVRGRANQESQSPSTPLPAVPAAGVLQNRTTGGTMQVAVTDGGAAMASVMEPKAQEGPSAETLTAAPIISHSRRHGCMQSATAAVIGSMKDWVWHGDVHKPSHLFYLLNNINLAEDCQKLGMASLRGDDAIRVQAAVVAAKEAGVQLALVKLGFWRLIKLENQRHEPGTYTKAIAAATQPGDSAQTGPTSQQPCTTQPGMLSGTQMQAKSMAGSGCSSEAIIAMARNLSMSDDDDAHCDDGDDLFADNDVIAYDWTTMHGTCFEEHSRMAVDVEQILQADGTSFMSLENCSEAAPRCSLALAMWPKSIAEQPGWGSDQEDEADKTSSTVIVGSKRSAAVVLGENTPGSASKRLKSPYELGARPDRTPEYYGRPYGFGP